MIRVAPLGNHIAYEPLPHLADQLARRFPGVDVRRAALSNVEGQSTFVYVKNLPGYSGLRQRSYPLKPSIETIHVRTERLDDHLSPGYAPRLIKIDVEGAEELVIEGAIGTITRHKPVVVFEHGKGASESYGTTPDKIFQLLCRVAGLRIFDLDGNGPYSLERFETTYERNSHWNFVAHA